MVLPRAILPLALALVLLCAAASAARPTPTLSSARVARVGSPARVSNLRDCPECALDVPALIAYNGYPAEAHNVTTADGFTLGVHRIPYSPRNATRGSRPPVLLQHGLLDSSATWVVNPTNESLAFLLADAGFDVWLGNNRGNHYSPPPPGSDWQFTWDDMAKYDVPAVIEFIRTATGAATVGYVGHSEGTTQMFAALATQPSLAAAVNVFVALAPVAYLGHQSSPLLSAMVAAGLDTWLISLGVKQFGSGPTWVDTAIAELLCGPGEPSTLVCEDVVFALCGVDPEQNHNLNASRVEVYISHTPAGTSMTNIEHYLQLIRNGTFQMYDWGSAAANTAHYGQPIPPNYDLSRITTPTALFTGSYDALADPLDVQRLAAELPASTVVLQHNEPDYDHIDFSWGVDAATRIYPEVQRMLRVGAGLEALA